MKGTPSRGMHNKRLHVSCRRCGKKSYHLQHHRCASCGFPDPTFRSYSWVKLRI